MTAPVQRARYRTKRPSWTLVHGASETAVRRAALLRCWDVGERLEYEQGERSDERLVLRSPEGKTIEGTDAGRELISQLPGLWWLWPINMFPGVGRLAVVILHQRT